MKMRQRKAQVTQEGICHPRMTLMSQGMLSRSKALLWSASVAAGMRGEGGIVAAATNSVAAVGGLAKNAGPERAGAAGRLVPKRLEVPKRGDNAGPA